MKQRLNIALIERSETVSVVLDSRVLVWYKLSEIYKMNIHGHRDY